MEAVGLLVTLIGGFGIAGLKSEVPEADPGERGEFSIGLGSDHLFVVRLRFFDIARGMEEVSHREEALSKTRMIVEFAYEALQRGPGVFGLALVDLQFGLGEKGVAGGDRPREIYQHPIESGDLAFGSRGGVGSSSLEMFLLRHLFADEDPTEHDRADCNGGKDLGAVPVERIDNAESFARGEGVKIRRFLGLRGLLGGFCHGLDG